MAGKNYGSDSEPGAAASPRPPGLWAQVKSMFASPTVQGVDIGGDGWMSVVGESFHRRELQRLMGAPPDRPREASFRAVLTPEPNNPKDHNAVKVTINGHHAGYLRRDAAEDFHAPIADMGGAHCPATIGCDGGEAGYGVRLRIDYDLLRARGEGNATKGRGRAGS